MRKKKRGRPLLFQSPEVLQEKINEYFEKGAPLKKVVVGHGNNKDVALIPVPTITGLALYCGFCDRHSFYEYEEKSIFTHTIKKARAAIERHYEELLQTGLGAGAIFALKNFGWKDEQYLKGQGFENKNIIINFHADGQPKPDSNRNLLSPAQAETFPRG